MLNLLTNIKHVYGGLLFITEVVFKIIVAKNDVIVVNDENLHAAC